MNIERCIGLAAATLTTLSFLPQVIRCLRTRDTRGISLWMYSVFALGIALWLMYGLLLHDLPITLANGVTLLLALVVLTLKLRHG
ncbi:MAG TPA: SemiSWEET transporter [Gammaproteobacteria bacterium]|nr:SemiSWEET transporter [Gammaproteobacteria bacterium]